MLSFSEISRAFTLQLCLSIVQFTRKLFRLGYAHEFWWLPSHGSGAFSNTVSSQAYSTHVGELEHVYNFGSQRSDFKEQLIS